MARPLRIEYAGAFYHVIQRGNEKRDIFCSDRDYRKFLEFLARSVDQYNVRIHAYCLMRNHYHIFMETKEANLSKAMHFLNVSYAVYFNKKHDRDGHLFQGRYRIKVVEKEEYLLHLSTYIHLNPVRARFVQDPYDYHYSSYGDYLFVSKDKPWLTTDLVLSYLRSDRAKARKVYEQYVRSTAGSETALVEENTHFGCILGSADFVEKIREKYIEHIEPDEEIPQLGQIRARPTMEGIHEIVTREIPDRKLARKVSIYLCRKYTGRTLREIANYDGHIGDTAVGEIFRKTTRARMRNKRLDEIIKRVEGIL